jgi:hypothetical protein
MRVVLRAVIVDVVAVSRAIAIVIATAAAPVIARSVAVAAAKTTGGRELARVA